MLLSQPAIKRHLEKENIIINPFIEKNLGPNSYDVTLGENYIKINPSDYQNIFFNPYSQNSISNRYQIKKAQKIKDLNILNKIKKEELEGLKEDDEVIILEPKELILGHTIEFIGGRHCVTSNMHARSTTGRLDLTVCRCAGFGDVGYINRWTMEIKNESDYIMILKVGTRLAQIEFEEVEPLDDYDYVKKGGSYQSTQNIDELIYSWTPSQMIPKKLS